MASFELESRYISINTYLFMTELTTPSETEVTKQDERIPDLFTPRNPKDKSQLTDFGMAFDHIWQIYTNRDTGWAQS